MCTTDPGHGARAMHEPGVDGDPDTRGPLLASPRQTPLASSRSLIGGPRPSGRTHTRTRPVARLVLARATGRWARPASPHDRARASDPWAPPVGRTRPTPTHPPLPFLIAIVDQGSDDPRDPIPLRMAFLLKKPLVSRK
jgi:hypothetical protein